MPPSARALALLVIAVPLTVLITAVALKYGAFQDYEAYQNQWQLVLDGERPWIVGDNQNAYGPIHNCFALLFRIDPLAPKIFFCLCWLGFFLLWAWKSSQPLIQILSVGFLSPFLWLEVAYFGHHDIFVAVLILGSCALLRRGSDHLAGVLLGIAAGLKFYPLVLIAYLGMGHRVRPAYIASSALSFLAVMGAGYWVWGADVATPLLFAAGRAPKILSLFYFFTTPLWPWPSETLQSAAKYLLAAATAVGWYFVRKREYSVERAASLGLLILFTTYHVGHQQFLVTLFLLLPFILIEEASSNRLRLAVICYLTFLTWFDVSYTYGGYLREPPWLFVRYLASLPTTLLAGWTIWELHGGTHEVGEKLRR